MASSELNSLETTLPPTFTPLTSLNKRNAELPKLHSGITVFFSKIYFAIDLQEKAGESNQIEFN
jgi:hypothetical protein